MYIFRDAILSSNPLSPPPLAQTFPDPGLPPDSSRSPLSPTQFPVEDSPRDSILHTPPSGPLSSLPPSDHDHHRSTYVLTDDAVPSRTSLEGRHYHAVHRRQISSDSAPRLSRPQLGEKDDLRLSVQRMFGDAVGGALFETDMRDEELLSDAAPSSGLERGEKMENPADLPDFSTITGQYPNPFPPVSVPRSVSGDSDVVAPSEAPSFNPSDLNPSRSASQVHRRTPLLDDEPDDSWSKRRALRLTQLHQGDHRASSIEELASVQDSTTDSRRPYDSTDPATVPYGSSASEMPLSPQEEQRVIAQSDALLDAKLSTLQQGIAFLVSDRSLEGDRLARFEDGLKEMGLDLKEVADVLRLRDLSPPRKEGEEGEAQALEDDEGGMGEGEVKGRATVLLDEVNGKLDHVLGLFEKLLLSPPSTTAAGSVDAQTAEGEGGDVFVDASSGLDEKTDLVSC